MPAGSSDDMWIGAKHDPALILPPDMNHDLPDHVHATDLPAVYEGKGAIQDTFLDHEAFPTEEELRTLPRIADKIPPRIYTVAFVELCERFSYYGTQILCS